MGVFFSPMEISHAVFGKYCYKFRLISVERLRYRYNRDHKLHDYNIDLPDNCGLWMI